MLGECRLTSHDGWFIYLFYFFFGGGGWWLSGWLDYIEILTLVFQILEFVVFQVFLFKGFYLGIQSS